LGPQKDKCSLIPIYLDYKEAVKLTSTYGQNFLDQINDVSGRVQSRYQSIGTDTFRISSGGKEKNGTQLVNLLNIPADAETRACFIAEDGNRWISIDYSGQESFIMASLANDKAMIKELTEGSKDLHSLTARLVFDEIPNDFPITEIKAKYHKLRQLAKGYEFCFNYAGNDSTLVRNYGISPEKAKDVYDKYMSGFSGLAAYQKFRKQDWWEKGYILLNPKTGHKAYICDYNALVKDYKSFQEKGF
jgi:DNA polymerase I-like protein with 3'-5' exonuclease and polymerase domains